MNYKICHTYFAWSTPGQGKCLHSVLVVTHCGHVFEPMNKNRFDMGFSINEYANMVTRFKICLSHLTKHNSD